MSTIDGVQALIAEIADLHTTDPETLQSLFLRSQQHRPLTRDEGETDHFCSMVAPIVAEKQLIFIGHHIKSGLWIPPGGHIDRGETPRQAAVRECKEELDVTVTEADIAPIAATAADITGRPNCTKHLDFWFILPLIQLQEFAYDSGEFHEAGWHPIDWAINACRHTAYTSVLTIIKQRMLQ